jgi:DNA-binding NtrC family response regulator
MTGIGPNILVVASDGHERAHIVATLGDAGFAVIAASGVSGALAALARDDCAVAVLAPQADDIALFRAAQRWRPALPVVLVLPPAARRIADTGDVTIVRRPFDPRQILGCVFELVLREGPPAVRQHSRAAEFGIAAAQLACLDSRRTLAAAAGRDCLERRLTRQIGRVREACRGLLDTR